MYIRNYRQQKKTWLGKSLRTLVPEQPSIVNTLKCPKHCRNLLDRTYIIFFITLRKIESENVSLSVM